MNAKLIVVLFLVMLLGEQCSSVKPTPSEKLRITLTDEYVEIFGEDSLSGSAVKDTTMLTLPPVPFQRVNVVAPAGRSAHAFDTVVVNAVVTKRGNVRRAWIVSSPNEFFNKAALKSIAQWKFRPAFRRGVAIDTLIKVPIPLSGSN